MPNEKVKEEPEVKKEVSWEEKEDDSDSEESEKEK